MTYEVHSCAGGQIDAWRVDDGAIHIKTRGPDPVELTEHEARELAALLCRLAAELEAFDE